MFTGSFQPKGSSAIAKQANRDWDRTEAWGTATTEWVLCMGTAQRIFLTAFRSTLRGPVLVLLTVHQQGTFRSIISTGSFAYTPHGHCLRGLIYVTEAMRTSCLLRLLRTAAVVVGRRTSVHGNHGHRSHLLATRTCMEGQKWAALRKGNTLALGRTGYEETP